MLSVPVAAVNRIREEFRTQYGLVTRDIAPVLFFPFIFSILFIAVPLAFLQGSAVLSDLAPQPEYDGIDDPHIAFSTPHSLGTFRWGLAFVLLFSLGLFVLTSGLLAMGLHRYRCEKRAAAPTEATRWFIRSCCVFLPAIVIIGLLVLAQRSWPWSIQDPFLILILCVLGIAFSGSVVIDRLRVGHKTAIAVHLITATIVVVCLGTPNGTLVFFQPGSEFYVLGLIGPLALLLVVLSFATLGVGLLASISRRWGIPLFTGFAVWMLLLGWYDVNDNHPVRLQVDKGRVVGRASATLAVRDDNSLWINDGEWPQIFARWRNATFPDRDRRPIVLVSAEGGGIRAAYFTAATLGRIADKCPRIAREMLAVSGVSGGALGVAAYAMAVRGHPIPPDDNRCDFTTAGRGYFEAGLSRMFRRDFLSPIIARAFFPDFFQRALPFPVPAFDRQLGFELALRQAFKSEFGVDSFDGPMGQPDGSYVTPFIVVGTTSVASGNPKLFSDFDQVPFDGRRLQAFNLASVVATSARFPLISPPGHFYGDISDRDQN